MPFKSEAQRRWMYANKPEMAKRWEKETSKGKDLPKRLKKTAGPLRAGISGAALAAALDLYSQRKKLQKDPTRGYKRTRGVIAALAGALGGVAVSKLVRGLGATAGDSAATAATRKVKRDMGYIPQKVLFK